MRRLLTHHSLAALFSGEPDGEKHRRRECRVATMQQYYTEAKERASTLMRGMEWKLQFHRSLLLADELLAMVVVLMMVDVSTMTTRVKTHLYMYACIRGRERRETEIARAIRVQDGTALVFSLHFGQSGRSGSSSDISR